MTERVGELEGDLAALADAVNGWCREVGVRESPDAVMLNVREALDRVGCQANRWRIERDAARRERDEARDWVKKLVRETQELRCAFCGETYPPNTPSANDDALATHIRKNCPKHPMREVETQRDTTVQAGQALREAVGAFVAGTAKRPLTEALAAFDAATSR